MDENGNGRGSNRAELLLLFIIITGTTVFTSSAGLELGRGKDEIRDMHLPTHHCKNSAACC